MNEFITVLIETAILFLPIYLIVLLIALFFSKIRKIKLEKKNKGEVSK